MEIPKIEKPKTQPETIENELMNEHDHIHMHLVRDETGARSNWIRLVTIVFSSSISDCHCEQHKLIYLKNSD